MSEESAKGVPRKQMPAYEIDGEMYVVEPSREILFRYDGRTRNPCVLAQADATVINGQLDTVHTDCAIVQLQHLTAGIERYLFAGDILDEPNPIFNAASALYAGGVVDSVGGEA